MNLAAPSRPRAGATATEARTALVGALSAAGAAATAYAPDSPTVGAAWPQWALTAPSGHIENPARHTFDCYVVLSKADAETTVVTGDQVVTAFTPHLERVGVIQTIEPVLITFGEGTSMPGIRFRVVTRA